MQHALQSDQHKASFALVQALKQALVQQNQILISTDGKPFQQNTSCSSCTILLLTRRNTNAIR